MSALPALSGRRSAVIDIGSNTVRLTVYDGLPPDYSCIVNTKDSCRLGRDLASTGLLSPKGVRKAYEAIGRFVARALDEGADDIVLLATAAVREARDGPAFCARVARSFGHAVRVLDADDEARLSALGVLAGAPRADGVIADLGGGSLELAAVSRGIVGALASLPLGHIRLYDQTGGDLDRAAGTIARHLGPVAWLSSGRGRELYVVGGAWRKLARAHIGEREIPVDGFFLARSDAEAVARAMLTDSARRPSRKTGRSQGMAMLLFLRLLAAVDPVRVGFTARGIGDGWLAERASAAR